MRRPRCWTCCSPRRLRKCVSSMNTMLSGDSGGEREPLQAEEESHHCAACRDRRCDDAQSAGRRGRRRSMRECRYERPIFDAAEHDELETEARSSDRRAEHRAKPATHQPRAATRVARGSSRARCAPSPRGSPPSERRCPRARTAAEQVREHRTDEHHQHMRNGISGPSSWIVDHRGCCPPDRLPEARVERSDDQAGEQGERPGHVRRHSGSRVE